jgi:hypothetical protein
LYPHSEVSGSDIDLSECPEPRGAADVFSSAVATFYAPSDLCGTGGMHRERIHATPVWKKGETSTPRYDCVLVSTNPTLPGMLGLQVARIHLFFSFRFNTTVYSCALVQWFETIGDEPDRDTGMWMVKPEYIGQKQSRSVIHLDCITRGTHLLPVFDEKFIPHDSHYSETLDTFRAFYVNKYIDHHTFEITS